MGVKLLNMHITSVVAIIVALVSTSDAATSARPTSQSQQGSSKNKDAQPMIDQDWYNSPPVVLSPAACRVLYLATSINPLISVVRNEYMGVLIRRAPKVDKGPRLINSAIGSVFYFARLRPRLLFVIGACVRALQCVTVIELVIDPTIGVGAGLNILALGVSSQWPAPLVLGWAMSKPAWRLLRAGKPQRHVRVPIGLPGFGGSV